MKKFLLVLPFLFGLNRSIHAQVPVRVTNQTITIAGKETQSRYYGFAAGDEVVFSFEELERKPLQIDIIAYGGDTLLRLTKEKAVRDKHFTIDQQGIYEFRFSNNSQNGRICQLNIDRIPAGESTRSFNPTVSLRTVYDTIQVTERETYLVRTDTSFYDFYSETFTIEPKNSTSGNPNYTVAILQPPRYSVALSCYIGTGNEGDAEYLRAMDAYPIGDSTDTVLFRGYSAMGALALTGVSPFNKLQEGHSVRYWVVNDSRDIQLFRNNEVFQYSINGEGINDAFRLGTLPQGPVYLVLLNDNPHETVTVTVKATAMIVTNIQGMRTVEHTKIVERLEPYLGG